MTSEESAELVELRGGSGQVAAVNFNIRFYPLNQHVRELVADGRAGRRAPGHRPLLPGLAAPRHRLELAPRAGPRRRAARGRRHRLALARPDRLHHRPARHVRDGRPGDLHPAATAADGSGRDVLHRARDGHGRARDRHRGRRHDPAALRERRARIGRPISQVSAGRKNSLQYEIDGSAGGRGWDSEQPDQLWMGHRDEPNEILLRNPALMTRPGGRGGPAGRPRRGLRRHVRGALPGHLRATSARGTCPSDPTYATFADGHEEMLVGDAIARARAMAAGSTSSREPAQPADGRSRRSRDEARVPDRALPRHAAHGRRRLGRRQRLREPRDRLLAARRRARRGATPAPRTSTSPNLSEGQATEIVDEIGTQGPGHLRPRLLPQPAASRPEHRARRVIAHLKLVIDAAAKMGVPFVNTFMGGDASKTLDENWDEALARLAGHREPRAGTRREDHDRELPDDLLRRRVAGRPQHRLVAVHLAPDHRASGAARSASTTTRPTWSG